MKSRKNIIVIAAVILLTSSIFLLDPMFFFKEHEAITAVPPQKEPAPQETVLYGMVVDGLHVHENLVKRNQRFTDLLSGYFVRPSIQRQFGLVPKESFDFKRIMADKKYTIIAEKDSARTARALVYEPNPIDYYVFHLSDSMWVESFHRALITKEKEVAGVIGSSLSETIDVLGISHELTNRFVDIFAWQIDFQYLQKGDRFKLFYEEQQVEGIPIGIGKILGIYFEHANQNYYAIPFNQGEGEEYYDADGKSLRKALLKYPIEFTRIASRYNLHRFHPIDKVYRAHLGTDFSAPMGTPIRAVGDGLVQEAQYKSRNGNYVRIRHNDTYTTMYLHMSKFGTGIRPGVRVKQGETIGYVGSTGLSTGPHLHYSFLRNGIQIDALRVELPPAQPIKVEFMSQFDDTKRQVIRRLDSIYLPEAPTILVSN